MARYNRELLVQYLEDVCTLHLAKAKLEKKCNDINLEVQSIQIMAEQTTVPEYESHIKNEMGLGTALICLVLSGAGILGFFQGLISGSIVETLLRMLVPMIILGVVFWIKVSWTNTVNAEIDKSNFEKEQKYRVALSEAKAWASIRIDRANQTMKIYSLEMNKIDGVLEKVYGVNIIPSHYRDVYAAVYLYDWFRTSRSDDLDMALNLYVLENIKSKLDQIIEKQAEAILNQRIVIANQYKSMEQQERQTQMLYEKLNRIEASNEERNTYLSMIEANTAANTYFSAANYFNN